MRITECGMRIADCGIPGHWLLFFLLGVSGGLMEETVMASSSSSSFQSGLIMGRHLECGVRNVEYGILGHWHLFFLLFRVSGSFDGRNSDGQEFVSFFPKWFDNRTPFGRNTHCKFEPKHSFIQFFLHNTQFGNKITGRFSPAGSAIIRGGRRTTSYNLSTNHPIRWSVR